MKPLASLLSLLSLSLAASAQMPPLPPAIPVTTNSIAVSGTVRPACDHAMLTWDGAAGAAYFSIYRTTNLLQPHWTLYGSTTIHCFIVDETNGPDAYYKVAAIYTNMLTKP